MLDGATKPLVCALYLWGGPQGQDWWEKRWLSEARGLLILTGFRAQDKDEKQICLREGGNLTVSRFYNIMLYASSLKAWQRVRSQGPPETLVGTNTRNADGNQAQAGRYLLEDDPINAAVRVTVTGLQRQDSGLYQCVINLSPTNPLVLFPRIRLVPCEGEQQQESRQGRVVEAQPLSRRPGRHLLCRLLCGDSTESWGKSAPPEIGAPGLSTSLLCDFEKVIAPLWASVFSPVEARKLDQVISKILLPCGREPAGGAG